MPTSEIISITVFILTASACATYFYKNIFGTED
jgi:hypothetical protein